MPVDCGEAWVSGIEVRQWGMRIVDACADLLLGATCPGCNRAHWGLCPQCLVQLDQTPQLVRRAHLTVAAAANYRPILARTIPSYKDDGALHLESVLSGLLARAVASLAPPPHAVLVPMPSLKAAVRRRGLDHAARLAGKAARLTGLRMQPALTRAPAGLDQQGLGRAARKANVAGSMRAKLPRGPVILVDDIVTTGATLIEAERALRKVKATVLAAAVIANADG